MWPVRVSNPEPLTYESGALPTALHGPAVNLVFGILGLPGMPNTNNWLLFVLLFDVPGRNCGHVGTVG